MKSKINYLLSLLLFTPGLGMSYCSAQAGAKGGGRMMESDLRSYIIWIDQFLDSDERIKVFPEIVEYEKKHPKFTFHELLLATRPVVQEEEVRDQFGIQRDCVSYDDAKGRGFVCQLSKLPEASLQNQPRMYRLVMHELLVQAGIELPVNAAIPSQYPVSARMMENVHLVTYQEWIPGKMDCDGWQNEMSVKMPNPAAAGFEIGNLGVGQFKGYGAIYFDTDNAHYDSAHFIAYEGGGGLAWATRVPDDETTFKIVSDGPSLLKKIGLVISAIPDAIKDRLSGQPIMQQQEMVTQPEYIMVGLSQCAWNSPSSSDKNFEISRKCVAAAHRSIRKTQLILSQLDGVLTRDQTKTVKCFQTKMRESLSAMDRAKRLR